MTMRRSLLVPALLPLLLVALPAQAAEKRCGYVVNPTPGNWWLTDGQGEWLIGTQGREPAPGLDSIPESFYENGWVRTNGYYGYRCGCLTVDSDRRRQRILRIHGSQPLPLNKCTADPALRGKRP
jgi:hypothetical protein